MIGKSPFFPSPPRFFGSFLRRAGRPDEKKRRRKAFLRQHIAVNAL